jgi:hypothetical protein
VRPGRFTSLPTSRLAGIARLITGPHHTSGCGHGERVPQRARQPPTATAATEAAESTEQKVEKTRRDLPGLVEEAAAGMRQLMAAIPGPGTGGAQTQDAQQAVSRLFEGVMATNKRFADELLDRAEPGPAVELQRRFVGEYFDALARGGTLLLRAAGEAAGQSLERQTRGCGGPEAGGEAAPAGRSGPAPTDRARGPRPTAPRGNGKPAPGKAAE